MNKYEQYNQFCVDHMNNDESVFFDALQNEFETSSGTALDIWYATQ